MICKKALHMGKLASLAHLLQTRPYSVYELVKLLGISKQAVHARLRALIVLGVPLATVGTARSAIRGPRCATWGLSSDFDTVSFFATKNNSKIDQTRTVSASAETKPV